MSKDSPHGGDIVEALQAQPARLGARFAIAVIDGKSRSIDWFMHVFLPISAKGRTVEKRTAGHTSYCDHVPIFCLGDKGPKSSAWGSCCG
jgi:hypothetical protein